MQGAYGGLIVILSYASLEAASEEFALITDDSVFILTDSMQEIDVDPPI